MRKIEKKRTSKNEMEKKDFFAPLASGALRPFGFAEVPLARE